MLAVAGCAALPGSSAKVLNLQSPPPAGYLLAPNAFAAGPAAATTARNNSTTDVTSGGYAGTAGAFQPRVLLLDSPTTRAYLERGGVNAAHRIDGWQGFLRRYKVPFQTIEQASQIDASPPAVLVLPSSIALSRSERQAIADFRARGGSVLATWAAGVRDESGNWLGFGFMKQVLGTEVVGTTAGEKTDQFLMTQGDSPVSHSLPAGHRIWTDRVNEWFPLRMRTSSPALHVMDWSRNFVDKRETAVGHFDERVYPGGTASRIVALGIPERLQASMDSRLYDAVLHDSLAWLLRMPSANVAAWPSGLDSAMLFAIDGVEIILDADLSFVRELENAGIRTTIYALGDNAKRSAERLTKLVERGHELAIMGDKFAGFRGQPAAAQDERLTSAKAKLREAGLPLPASPGFHAPTESYDKATLAAISGQGFGHFIAMQDIGETRTPILLPAQPGAAAGAPRLVAFPRTQRGPEDATEEGDVEDGLKSFYAELALSIRMRGLAVIRMPNQGLLPLDTLREIAAELTQYKGNVWMATASELAAWWVERERVRTHVEGDLTRPVLSVTLDGSAPLRQPVTVLVHLPSAQSELELLLDGQADPRVKIFRIDAQRAGVQLSNLAAGTHRWSIRLDAAAKTAAATPASPGAGAAKP